MTDDITKRLRAEVPKMPDSGTPIARPCTVRSELLLEAAAEIERLREALVLGSEVLASHQGSPQREWHSVGAWLYPGDSINVVSAPLPEIKVEP